LRYMPRLTPAQQAAAANFGHFPRAAEIGRDDPRVAAYAKPLARPALAAADTPLVPAGQPLGKGKGKKDERKGKPVKVAEAPPPPVPQPRREETTAGLVTPTPSPVAVSIAPPATVTVAESAPARVFATKPADPAPAPVQVAVESPAPAFDLAAAAPAAAAPAAAAPRPSLSDAFADLGRPDAAATVAAGAVDVRRVTPVRPAPATATAAAKPAAKAPAKPAHPSRIWVQVATGRDKAALGFDWRRLVREDAAVFRGKSPHVSAWGQTNRLLTGPFETQAAANAFIAQLRRADVDGAFLWTSPAGQVVDALSVK
ncbi:MAG: SPOR domain-containing protein, partial [Novosphingobium sp.]